MFGEKNRKKPEKPHKSNCFVIRDHREGLSQDEYVEIIPDGAQKWKLFGGEYFLLFKEFGVEGFKPFTLPDDIPITPETIGRIPGFESWHKYKNAAPDLWDQIKPVYPIIALLVAGLVAVMILG